MKRFIAIRVIAEILGLIVLSILYTQTMPLVARLAERLHP